MDSPNRQLETEQVIEINWADRWLVYHRLQELSIPCICQTNQPLRVTINNPTAAIQLWSVSQQWNAPRHELVSFLESSWKLRSQ